MQGGDWGRTKSLKHFFRISTTSGFPNMLEYGEKNQKCTKILKANNIKIYAVLSDFAKCCILLLICAPLAPKIEGDGVLPIWAMPVFRLFFMASLRQLTVTLWTGESPILGSHTSLVFVQVLSQFLQITVRLCQ